MEQEKLKPHQVCSAIALLVFLGIAISKANREYSSFKPNPRTIASDPTKAVPSHEKK